MTPPTPSDLKNFHLPGHITELIPYGNGHIHDTFLARSENEQFFIIQRFNQTVFPDPDQVIENIRSVTAYLEVKLRETHADDWYRRVLKLVPTQNGSWYFQDSKGDIWRAFDYIPKTVTYEEVTSTEQAFALGKAFGEFQVLLEDFSEDLHDTIENFHHTRKRFSAFQAALTQSSLTLSSDAAAEIQFAHQNEWMADKLIDLQSAGQLPLRVTHNDTKVNNLLFDKNSGEGLCVIDLDTVMPGLSLFDFGDMVRTGIATAPESERDLSRINIELDQFQALAAGYLRSTRQMITDLERKLLVFAGQLLTYETGLRFLTDHLQGDIYFKISYPGQNLDRCRNQFQLLKVMQENQSQMSDLVAKAWNNLKK